MLSRFGCTYHAHQRGKETTSQSASEHSRSDPAFSHSRWRSLGKRTSTTVTRKNSKHPKVRSTSTCGGPHNVPTMSTQPARKNKNDGSELSTVPRRETLPMRWTA